MSSPVRVWAHDPLPAEVRLALARLADVPDVAVVAAMPDVHLARAVCVGAVVATRTCLFPDAVGGDIGCGMSALRFDGEAAILADRALAARVLAMLGERVPTTRRRSGEAALPPALAERSLSAPALEKKKGAIGRVQLGTLGGGNHFVELQRDDEGGLWLMLHSGSRGMGQAIREHHGGADGELRPVVADSPEGQRYLADLEWALDYARASRRAICAAVVAGVEEITGLAARWDSHVDCHHNFVRRESHGGELLWVHRKGAISAAVGEAGIIPGSMGSASYHASGRGDPEALCSSSHGAGRNMNRSEARAAITVKSLTRQMHGIWFDHRLADRLRDEAPGAYKDIGAVMRAQQALTRVVRRLTPLLVYKGA